VTALVVASDGRINRLDVLANPERLAAVEHADVRP
jgi:hypothetical protein